MESQSLLFLPVSPNGKTTLLDLSALGELSHILAGKTQTGIPVSQDNARIICGHLEVSSDGSGLHKLTAVPYHTSLGITVVQKRS